MRITFLVHNLNGMGGTSRSAITQANALADAHTVQLVSIARLDEEPHYAIDPRIRVDYLVEALPDAEPRSDHVDIAPELAARLHERQSSLVPAHWDVKCSALTDAAMEVFLPRLESDVLVTVAPGLLAASVQLMPPGTALVHQEHRSSSDRGSGVEALLAFAPRADVVALLTTSTKMWLSDQLGEVSPPLVVMPNPLPVGFAPRSPLTSRMIVAAGRLVGEKQFPKLVSAFAEIADEIPDWRLRILGDGPQYGELRRLTRRYRLWDRVELPGRTPDMPGEWARASVSALTSRSEGLPLVVQEAMAAGVPVASFDCPSGPREIIEHGVNGLLVSPDSVSGMAAALLQLTADGDLRVKLGEGAYHSSRQYAPEVLAAQWETIFQVAIDRRRSASTGRLLQRSAGAPDDAPAAAGETRAPEGVTPRAAREAALRWAVRIADRVSADWFVLPPHETMTPVVVVPMPDRDDYLRELASAVVPAYLSLVESGDFGWPERRGPAAELAQDLRRGRSPRLHLEPWPLHDGKPTVLTQGCRVDVEFWELAPSGELVAPAPNPYSDRVPRGAASVETEIEGVPVRTLPLMAAPTVRECRFPVDVVYTWVDGADPVWSAAREERLSGLSGTARTRESSGTARFISRDELRYSMRSVHLFAPWVRTIHLVTAGQVPAWLDTDHPRIRVVDHTEILPADALPTFNSHAIETGLHHIPDLAEQWIYINDDVLLGRPLRPEDFFTAAGHFVVFPSVHGLGLDDQPDSAPYRKAGWNNRRLLRETFGVVVTDTLAHTPHPHRTSVLREIEERYPDAVARTARAPFRTDTDVSMLSSLAQHYGLITGTAVSRVPNNAFVNLSASNLMAQFRRLLDRRHDFLCIGDQHVHAHDPQGVASLLAEFLADYFPVAAPWEKGSPS